MSSVSKRVSKPILDLRFIVGKQQWQHMLRLRNEKDYIHVIPVFHGVEDTSFYKLIQSSRRNQSYNNSWNVHGGHRGSMGRTSAIKSDVIMQTDIDYIHFGDVITVRVIARDINGRRRILGGDLWRASIYNTTRQFASMGKVIDHNNGTYTIHFYAGSPGVVNLKVVLVLQREAIKYQNDVFRPTEKRASWEGVFRSNNITETSRCVLVRDSSWMDKCEFPHPRALGKTIFLCDLPDSLRCNTLTSISNVASETYVDIMKIDGERKKLFKTPNAAQVLTSSISKFIIQPEGELLLDGDENNNIPQCDDDLPEPTSDGYWLGTRWHSLVCNAKQWNDVAEVQNCLRDKHVFLLGDSTSVQWLKKVLEIAGYPQQVNDSNWRKTLAPVPGSYNITVKNAYACDMMDIRNNINFTFRHHALSRHNEIPIPRFPFFVDTLDNMAAPKCNYVIAIGLWAHFDTWTLDSFEELLVNIRSSIQRLKARCPNTVIAIKGPHERNMIANYWILYDMIRILKETFRVWCSEREIDPAFEMVEAVKNIEVLKTGKNTA
ncbi:NXPE family member 1-like [Saccoglossus kowalevskii]|uniref:NXPE family member 2-like n=1 Tax=Saccoglossus kowalevskii TaxID=10224 RepID=A0ABM0MSX9_SACKO|nr:PREDICTED: NXPE family member 2-like [Saccoglossus kowalevskii]